MILTVKERFTIINDLFPERGNIIEIMLVKSIIGKVEFTPEEIAGFGIVLKNGFITWDKEGDFDIDLKPSEMELLKDSVSKMDANKQITIENVDLCRRIKGE